MLVILSGLPGSGKTTLARLLAERLSATHLRIDTIETVLADHGVEVGPLGYLVAYALAADNLGLGGTVVADGVNPVEVARSAWRRVAREAGVAGIEVEIRCSDAAEHRRRVETRRRGASGALRLPTWDDVAGRAYDSRSDGALAIDTFNRTPEACADEILAALRLAL